MYKVDLNSDLGESFGSFKVGCDEEVTRYVSSVNIACGYHGGDPIVMGKTLDLVKQNGIAAGAHPSYPDLMGFGRRNMDCTPAEINAYVTYQLGALYAFAKQRGLSLQHVKPHGNLYNTIAVDEVRAMAVAEAIADFDPSIILLGLAGSKTLEAGRKCGLKVASEVFADRAYNEDGTLVSRKLPGSMVHDPEVAIARTIKMVREGVVVTLSGKTIPIMADSVCVHGDNPSAVEFVKNMRAAFAAEGIEVLPIAKVIA